MKQAQRRTPRTCEPMKFTIRDLLWLTVVVALGVGWYLDHERMMGETIRRMVEGAKLESIDQPNPSAPALNRPSE